ncbi:Hsp70 family protein [Nocardioides sp. NPDC057767]|uniref:Hsp70 family protein n=1 Tax=unclassified Nocardioides TaxID=2615069 RepID=UPI0036700E49
MFGQMLDDEHAPVAVLGIDLGTTYSTVTRIAWSGLSSDLPELDVVPIKQFDGASTAGRLTVPSAVAVVGSSEVRIGEEARAARRDAPERMVPGWSYFENSKNDIGTSKRYAGESAGIGGPVDVAAKILRFIVERVQDEFQDDRYDQVVVTVPASFQLTQRTETIAAAARAGLDTTDQNLLDEPVAALLSWLARSGTASTKREQTLVVDFGGGTCDIALVAHRRADDSMDVEVVGTSRYTRLGGSDIDRAIAVEHLMPKLAAHNGIDPTTWTYGQKALAIVPRLAEAAEELKLKLSRKMADREQIGRGYDDVEVRSSRDAVVVLDGRELVLPAAQMTLSAKEFGAMLAPFLNSDLLTHCFGEYYETASIFGPILDILDRTRREPGDVDRLLLVGGSSYLPPIRAALEKFFDTKAAYVVAADDPERQTEISQGAALHAFSLAVAERSLARVNGGEALQINLTGDGGEAWGDLIPANVELPWHDVEPERRLLRVTDARRPIRFEFQRAGLGVSTTEVPVPSGVKSGDCFDLEFGLDGSGSLHLHLRFSTGDRVGFTIERPGSFILNPGVDRERILEIEERRAQADLSETEVWGLRRELVGLYQRIGHLDLALAHAEWILSRSTTAAQRETATTWVSSARMARGDVEGGVNAYRSAIDGGARYLQFNLANKLNQLGRNLEALEVLEKWMTESTVSANFALRGRLLKALGRPEEAKADFDRARVEFGSPVTATRSDRTWMRYVADQLGDRTWLDAVREADLSDQESPTPGALPMRAESEA